MREILRQEWRWLTFCSGFVFVVGVLFVYAASQPRDHALQINETRPAMTIADTQ